MRPPLAWFRGVGVAALLFLAPTTRSAAAPSFPPRITATYAGIIFEFSPGQEELAQRLAERFAAWNRQIAAEHEERDHTVAPLSVDDMRANEKAYLREVAHLLALKRPSALQVECYEAFLRNYDLTMRLFANMREHGAQLAVIHRVTVWDRSELIGRLTSGEAIAGFGWDPQTGTGSMTFATNFQGHDDQLKELMQQRHTLHRQYQLKLSPADGGGTRYRALVAPLTSKLDVNAASANVAAKPAESENQTELFPVVIPADLAGKPAAELAQHAWDRPEQGVSTLLGQMRQMIHSVPRKDPTLAFLMLHEATEVGIIDHYLRGPDRRWFCDGVANYVAWRTIRDRHGAQIAKTAYDLDAEIARQAQWRTAADLSHWPAIENESEADQTSELDAARYIFATKAVALMNERAGEDILPRLFREIGKQKSGQANYGTIEAAWHSLTGSELRPIVAEATR